DRLELQYRRNDGEWTPVEAHDFPYPLRELEMDFADVEAGSTPEGWRAAAGDEAGIAVAAREDLHVLRARADDAPLIALYTPPWELDQFAFAAEYRLAADTDAFGLVFGYLDTDNHWRVLLDAGSKHIRV